MRGWGFGYMCAPQHIQMILNQSRILTDEKKIQLVADQASVSHESHDVARQQGDCVDSTPALKLTRTLDVNESAPATFMAIKTNFQAAGYAKGYDNGYDYPSDQLYETLTFTKQAETVSIAIKTSGHGNIVQISAVFDWVP